VEQDVGRKTKRTLSTIPRVSHDEEWETQLSFVWCCNLATWTKQQNASLFEPRSFAMKGLHYGRITRENIIKCTVAENILITEA
jgi:hypothetical protein